MREAIRARLLARPGRALILPGVPLRESAVLVPLFFRGGRLQALFTKRPRALRDHGGQISFPGGAREDGDATPLHTALRETKEELGIPPEKVDVLGMLDEIATITRYRVIPFVGVIPPDIRYAPNAEEVEEIIEAPIEELVEEGAHRFTFGPHLIWGATAKILTNLLSVLK